MDHTGSETTVYSVRALGPGLHFYVRASVDGPPTHLKIAQPRHVNVANDGIEMRDAKYVQWRGRRITKVPGAKALVLKTTGLASRATPSA